MSGPTRFCPACYARNAWSSDRCRACGASLASDDDLDQRLIWALGHPDTETAARAAAALAARHASSAIGSLAALVERTDDPYRSAAAAAALVAFTGDRVADEALERAAAHPSVVVRASLERARTVPGR